MLYWEQLYPFVLLKPCDYFHPDLKYQQIACTKQFISISVEEKQFFQHFCGISYIGCDLIKDAVKTTVLKLQSDLWKWQLIQFK
jgi:hypothetical protein